jgi:phage-related protein (TIGR01555 family)
MKRVALSPSNQPRVPKSHRVNDGINPRILDGLQNLVTGLGTDRDKTRGTTFVFAEMDKAQLEAAFRSDWIARKIVNIPAQDATREWRTWQSDKADTKLLEEAEKKINLQGKTFQAMFKARLYGGAGLLLGVDQGNLQSPLDETKVGKDGLKFVHAVSRWELAAGPTIWDLSSEWYGQPEYYTRNGGGTSQGEKIHPSRVVRFLGNQVPDITLNPNQGWGDSVLQVTNDAVIAAGMASAGGSQLLHELKMDVIKIPGLSGSLSNKKYEGRLSSRFAAANVMKSLYNILLLDSEEDWERITASLTGLPDSVKLYLLIASGAADIPTTRFLGQSPAGLNATGESDLRNYYDHIGSVQETDVDPAMQRLNTVLIRSATGTAKPEDVTHEWRPLWQIEASAKSTIIQQKAAAYQIDVAAAQIPAEVLRDARINQLIEDGVYPGLDQILEDYGPLGDIEEPPEPGSVIGPDGEPISPSDPKHPNNQVQIDPKTGRPVAANVNAPPNNKKAVGDMAARIRDAEIHTRAVRDATPRSLYVSRRVMNAPDILKWAKGQGIPDLEPAEELHVTIFWTQDKVDWTKVPTDWSPGEQDGNLHIPPGGMRMVDKFGGGLATVILFQSSVLSWRFRSIKDYTGANYDFADYQPHVTVSNKANNLAVDKLQAYQGAIELGPELWQEANSVYFTRDERGNPYKKATV